MARKLIRKPEEAEKPGLEKDAGRSKPKPEPKNPSQTLSPEMRESLGRNLMLAAERGDGDKIRRLVKAGADPDYSCITYTDSSSVLVKCEYSDEQSKSVLEVACFEGYLDSVRALLECGSKVSPRIFVVACYQGDPDVINLLINHGADVNAKDEAGTTPLSAAVSMGNVLATLVLVNRGAKDNIGCDIDRGYAEYDIRRILNGWKPKD